MKFHRSPIYNNEEEKKYNECKPKGVEVKINISKRIHYIFFFIFVYFFFMWFESIKSSPFPKEHRLHLSEGQKNRVRTEKDRENNAIKRNKSGYYMVSKMKEPRVTQGFVWRYNYYEDGKRKAIMSIDLDKLEKKVKEKGLKWRRL